MTFGGGSNGDAGPAFIHDINDMIQVLTGEIVHLRATAHGGNQPDPAKLIALKQQTIAYLRMYLRNHDDHPTPPDSPTVMRETVQRLTPLRPHVSPWHFLGAELRWWRIARGMSLTELAHQVPVGEHMLGKIEKAVRVATSPVIDACDLALNTGGVLSRLLAFAENATPGEDRVEHPCEQGCLPGWRPADHPATSMTTGIEQTPGCRQPQEGTRQSI